MPPRAVTCGDRVGLRDNKLMRLARIFVQDLRLTTRDFDPFVQFKRTSA
jgi:hypothetical protein